uniref:DUF7079 family protein n=1 Tax=Phytohalomonas tamaricis TaxID=2081032 RepID=UPI002948BC41|nr:hypothetical protein [Phytohalomonas tamaricis]
MNTTWQLNTMTDTETIIAARRELWLALAPLWLDREPSEKDYVRMADEIDRHDLTAKQLEWIYRLELSPVLAKYQASMVGGWRNFDEDTILPQLVGHCKRLTPWRRRLWLLFSGLTTMMTRHRWGTLMELVLARRGHAID